MLGFGGLWLLVLLGACSNDGKHKAHGQCDIYYTEPVSSSQIDALVSFLDELGLCQVSQRRFQVLYEGDAIVLKAEMPVEMLDKVELDRDTGHHRLIGQMIQDQVFRGQSFVYILCDAEFAERYRFSFPAQPTSLQRAPAAGGDLPSVH
jgi:hypothetical protein